MSIRPSDAHALQLSIDVIMRHLSAVRAWGGEEAVDGVLEEVGYVRSKPISTVQSPGTHLASAMSLVEDYVLPAETGPSGNNDSVEAAVCLRRRIREALSYWSTLEALRQKQGR